MRFLEFINNPQQPQQRRAHVQHGEQQWRQQAEQNAGKPRQHWVQGQGGRKHGPFKDYQTADQFRNSRSDVGSKAQIKAENEEQSDKPDWAQKPTEYTWNDLAQKINEMDQQDRDSIVMVWDGGHFRQVDKIDYVDDPEIGYVPALYCAD